MSLFVLAVGLVGRCRYLRLLLCLLVGVVVCACCRIGWVSLFAFVVELIVLYRYLRLLSDLLGGADVSAVGTTLLQSPG